MKASRFVVSGKMPFVGVGFYWAWLLLVFYSDTLIPIESSIATDVVNSIWLWAACFHFLSLIGIALLAPKLRMHMNRAFFLYLGGAGTAVFTLALAILVMAVGVDSPLFYPIEMICLAGMGLCSAWFITQWGNVYVEKLGRSRSGMFAFSYALSLAFYLMVMVFPSELHIFLTVMLPVAGALALKRCVAAEPEPSSMTSAAALASQSAISRASVSSQLTQPVLLLSVFAMSLTALCGEVLRSISVQLANETVNFMGVSYALGSLVGAAVLVFAARAASGFSLRVTMPLVRNCFLVMAAAFLFVPLMSSWSIGAAYALFGAGFWSFRSITWVMCFNYVQRTSAEPIRAVAVLDAAFTFAPIVSGRIVPLISQHMSDALSMSLAASVMIYVLLATIVFLLSGRRASVFEDPDLIADLDVGLLKDLAEDPHSQSSDTNAPNPVVALAERYGLSGRETEVFALLARGRSLPYIQNELVISEGTAQTHARHIYKKMGVHSRQELHDLVDREYEQDSR